MIFLFDHRWSCTEFHFLWMQTWFADLWSHSTQALRSFESTWVARRVKWYDMIHRRDFHFDSYRRHPARRSSKRTFYIKTILFKDKKQSKPSFYRPAIVFYWENRKQILPEKCNSLADSTRKSLGPRLSWCIQKICHQVLRWQMVAGCYPLVV